MDYNTNYNNTADIQTRTNNKALIFAITLLIIGAAVFAFFYYFYVVRTAPIVPTAPRDFTQEEIDAIIAKEPESSEENLLSQDEINAIIKAEGEQTSGTELTDEQILKIKQAN